MMKKTLDARKLFWDNLGAKFKVEFPYLPGTTSLENERMSPEKGIILKGKFIFQPSIFRGGFQGSIFWGGHSPSGGCPSAR